MTNVTIYTSRTCPYCTMAKDFMESEGIVYEDKDIGIKENRMFLIDREIQSVPAIFIGEEVIVGLDKQRILDLAKK